MSDITAELQVALKLTRAWPDEAALNDVMRQSEASSAQLVTGVIELANLLVGLIAHAERATEEATFDKMERILEGRAAREAGAGL